MDVDGSLCDTSAALPLLFKADGTKDFAAFHEATRFAPTNQIAVDFVNKHHAKGRVIIIMTARMEEWRQLTEEWLDANCPVPFVGPSMRKTGDRRQDTIVKRELFEDLSKDYDIVAAMDDSPRVHALWLELGIPAELIPGWEEERTLIDKANRIKT